MFPGSGESSSSPIYLTEEEIFSRPVVNTPWGGEEYFGDIADYNPVALQWGDCEAEDFETLTNLNSALSVNIHSISFNRNMRQPASDSQQVVIPVEPVNIPHSVQTRSNEGGLEDVVEECNRRQRHRQAEGSSASNATPQLLWFRDTYNNSSLALRRRPAGISPTMYSMELRRKATEKGFERPAVHQENPRTPVYPHYIPSVLKHPFHVPILPPIARPGMYSIEDINAGVLPRPPALFEPFSAPEVKCTLPTTTRINPVQEQASSQASMGDLRNGPLMSSDSDTELTPDVSRLPVRALFGPFTAPDEKSTALTATTTNPVQEQISVMAGLQFGPLINADSECQPIASHERDFNYPSPSSEWSMRGSMEEVDLWDHSSIETPFFLEQAPEPMREQCQVHEGPVVTDQTTAAHVSSPHFVTDPPKPEQQQCQDPGLLKEMEVEVKSTRLRWIPELHDKFVTAVTSLGGPDVATPKAVLRAMECADISIYHIKSHLQKFRLQQYSPRGTKRHHPYTSEQVTLDLGETSEVQNDMQARLHQSIEVDLETTENMALLNNQLQRTIAAQKTQLEQLEKMKRMLENQKAITHSSAVASADQLLAQSSSSPEAGVFTVQVPKLVIVANECEVIYSSDDEGY